MNSLPDGNRIWFSVGAKYQLGKNHVIDAAYSHIHINDTVYRTGKASGNDVDSRGASSARFKTKRTSWACNTLTNSNNRI